MWMDVRSSDQADRIARTHNDALKYNGYGPVSAEWGLPKALWIKDNEPGSTGSQPHLRLRRLAVHRLTGEWAFSINFASSSTTTTATRAAFPRASTTRWTRGICSRYPQDVLDLGTVAGELSKEAAEELGLSTGTPVAEGE